MFLIHTKCCAYYIFDEFQQSVKFIYIKKKYNKNLITSIFSYYLRPKKNISVIDISSCRKTRKI